MLSVDENIHFQTAGFLGHFGRQQTCLVGRFDGWNFCSFERLLFWCLACGLKSLTPKLGWVVMTVMTTDQRQLSKVVVHSTTIPELISMWLHVQPTVGTQIMPRFSIQKPSTLRGFQENLQKLVGGLVAIFWIFPYIGFLIIPIDEIIFFSRGGPTTNQEKKVAIFLDCGCKAP